MQRLLHVNYNVIVTDDSTIQSKTKMINDFSYVPGL